MYFRGISSTVRRCIEKETGIEYAAKIIDVSNETQDGMKDATLQEVQILRRAAGHPYISRFSISIFAFLSYRPIESTYDSALINTVKLM